MIILTSGVKAFLLVSGKGRRHTQSPAIAGALF